jgi:hypothetical protein
MGARVINATVEMLELLAEDLLDFVASPADLDTWLARH